MEPLALTGNYRLAAAIVFGMMLGIIFIRSEIAWRKTFIDQFSMRNSQLFKTLFFSIGIGIMLFYLLKVTGLVRFHIAPTYFWGAVLGGMICAAGAVFCGQMPSTAVSAIGAGRIYALWVFVGMMMALPFVQLISSGLLESMKKWPRPMNYAESLDKFFTGGNIFIWFAIGSIIMSLFFGFISPEKGGRNKKDDQE